MGQCSSMTDERDESTVGPTDHDDARASRLAAEGWRLFAANDFAAARLSFARAVAAGHDEPDVVRILADLHGEAGDFAAAADVLAAYLRRVGPDLSPADRLDWALARFDAVRQAGLAHERREEAALQVLEATAAAGEGAWSRMLEPGRRQSFDAAIVSPLGMLTRLEQESFAPAVSGLPALVPFRAEELGHFHASDAAVARGVERMLHALGEREAAYRVERSRRAATRSQRDDQALRLNTEPPRRDARGWIVVLVGGHPALRALARRDLVRSGVAEVREIPSAWEATRHERDVRRLLMGADIAVLIVRLLAHSTSDQVRAVASLFEVPVVAAETATVGAIWRAIERYRNERDS